jgi:hypothetical protein
LTGSTVEKSPAMLSRLRRDRGAVAWMIVVAVVYLGATLAVSGGTAGPVDRAMQLAANLVDGRFDLTSVYRRYDTVIIDGRIYMAMSPLPIVPYVAFVPFPELWAASRWIIAATLGMVAGWLALPLARRYGPPGPATWWLAVLSAFGTLLLTQSVTGNFYYLAHVEAVLFTFVALIEWQGRRRPWLIGLAFGLAGLARPTVLLAAIPFGIALAVDGRDRVRALAGYATPIALSIAVAALYNFVRFGSPLETGYGLTEVNDVLAARRAQGLLSIRHLPDNVALFLAGGFDMRGSFPYLVPNPNGHSILLTTPALLAAVGAALRERLSQVLWAATAIVAIPVFLYYGGGGWITYGYRYALDFTPFLLALVALAARNRFGALEKLLIGLSVAFVGYGVVWLVVN